MKGYNQCNNLENKNQIVKQEVIESDELEEYKKIIMKFQIYVNLWIQILRVNKGEENNE